MAACPTSPIILKAPFSVKSNGNHCKFHGGNLKSRAHHVHSSASTANYEEEVGIFGERQNGYLATGFGWGVRRMMQVGEEMKNVACVQAEAFHEPVALFDDFFFDFFKAEVLSALLYRIRNSAPDRYACLVAESMDESDSQSEQEIVGVVDITVQRDGDVLQHIKGAEKYLYVSGIAVLLNFRRKKVATVLLEACDTMSRNWGHEYLALRAYEDDNAAQKLYANAGYRIVSRDPYWITWIGKKRRVLMIKESALN